VDTPAPRRRFDVVAYLKLFRFPLVFTAIADSMTGFLLGRGSLPREDLPTLGCLALASAGLYFFGMSLNDISDLEKDKAGAPGKVLPSGRLTPTAARIACGGALLLSLGAILLGKGAGRPVTLGVWGLIVLLICGYDVFLKIPPTMGLVRAGNLLLGVTLSVDLQELQLYWHSVIACILPIFVYVTALTYVSTLEDTVPDRRRLFIGVGAMIIGGGLASFVFPLADALRFFGSWHPRSVKELSDDYPGSLWKPIPFTLILAGWLSFRAWKALDRKGVMLLVRDGIGGVILLDSALLASSSDYPFSWLVAGLVIPAALCVALFKKLA
jgi:hypothetical protein